MVAFGESVISLLEETHDYRNKTLEAFTMSFTMMLMLTITYFDIIDADEFLHILWAKGDKIKAWCFMCLQGPLSFLVFFIGKLLSCVLWAHEQQRSIHRKLGGSISTLGSGVP